MLLRLTVRYGSGNICHKSKSGHHSCWLWHLPDAQSCISFRFGVWAFGCLSSCITHVGFEVSRYQVSFLGSGSTDPTQTSGYGFLPGMSISSLSSEGWTSHIAVQFCQCRLLLGIFHIFRVFVVPWSISSRIYKLGLASVVSTLHYTPPCGPLLPTCRPSCILLLPELAFCFGCPVL